MDQLLIKDSQIQDMRNQLAVQMRDFQEHERKVEMKYAREIEVFKVKNSQQGIKQSPFKSSEGPEQVGLVQVLKDQLRESTQMLRTQLAQIQALKQKQTKNKIQIVNEANAEKVTFNAEIDKKQKELAQVISERDQTFELLQTLQAELEQQSTTLQQQKKQIQVKDGQLRDLVQELALAKLKLNQEQKQNSLVLGQMENDLEISNSQVRNLQSEYKNISDQLETQTKQYKVELEQLKTTSKKTDERHRIELAQTTQAFQSQLKDALTVVENTKKKEVHQQPSESKIRQSILSELKREFDLKLSGEVSLHLIERNHLVAQVTQVQAELKLQHDQEASNHERLVRKEVAKVQKINEKLLSAEIKKSEQYLLELTELKQQQQDDVKWQNAKHVSLESQQHLQAAELQKEIQQLRVEIKAIESKKEHAQSEYKQIQEKLQLRIDELESQEKVPDTNRSVISEQENIILQMRAELDSLKELNDRLEKRIQKAQSDIKDQQQQKKEQALKMAKQQKDSMMQTNEDKKLIKELQSKLEQMVKAEAEVRVLLEKESDAKLKKQVQDGERALGEMQDEYRILEGQLRYANSQRDVLESELEQLKLSQQSSSNIQASATHAESTELRTQLDNATSECEQQRQTIADYETEIQRLIDEGESERNQAFQAVELLQSQSLSIEQSASKESQANAKKVKTLQLEVEEQKKIVQSQREDLKVLRDEKEEFQEQIKLSDQVRIDHLEQIDEYQEEVNSHKQAIQTLEDKYLGEIEQLNNQVASLLSAEDDYIIQVQGLEQSIAEAQESIQHLSEQNQIDLDKVNEELKQQQNTSSAKQKALMGSLENSKKEFKEIRDKFENIERDLALKQDELVLVAKQYEGDKMDWARELEKVRGELKQAQLEIESLKLNIITDNACDRNAAADLVLQFELSIQKKDQEIDELQAQLKQKVLEQVQTSFKLKMAELEKSQTPAVETTDFEALQFKVQALEQDLKLEKTANEQFKELRQQHKQLQEQHIQLQREHHTAKDSLKVKISEILELTEQQTKLQSELQDLKQKSEDQSINQIDRDQRAKREEISQQREQITLLLKQNQDLQSVFTSKDDELSKTQESLQKARTQSVSLQSEIERITYSTQQLQVENKDLRSDFEELIKMNEATQEKIKDLHQQQEVLNVEIQERDTLLEEMEKEIEDLKQAEQQTAQDFEHEQQARADLEAELLEKEKEMTEQNQEAEAVQADLEAQIVQLQDELAVHGAPESELQLQVTDLISQNNIYKDQEEDLLQQIHDLEEQLTDTQNQLSESQVQLDELSQQQKKEMDEMSEQCLQEITASEEKADQLEQQLSLTESENERLTQELNSVDRQLKAAHKKLKDQSKDSINASNNTQLVEQELLSVRLEKEALQKQDSLLREQLSTLQLEHQDGVQDVILKLQGKVSQAEKENLIKQKQITANEQMVESLAQQMSAQEAEIKKLHLQAKQAQVNIQMQRMVVDQLQVQLGDCDKQIAKYKASEASGQKTIENLSVQLSMLMSNQK